MMAHGCALVDSAYGRVDAGVGVDVAVHPLAFGLDVETAWGTVAGRESPGLVAAGVEVSAVSARFAERASLAVDVVAGSVALEVVAVGAVGSALVWEAPVAVLVVLVQASLPREYLSGLDSAAQCLAEEW